MLEAETEDNSSRPRQRTKFWPRGQLVLADLTSLIVSCVDYCLGLLAGAPKKTTDKLQRVLNAAARVEDAESDHIDGQRQKISIVEIQKFNMADRFSPKRYERKL